MAGITVDFNANLARLDAGVNQANARLDSFADNAQRVASGISSALGAIGVGVSVAGMSALVKATIDEADALDVLNQKTGIAVETLAGIKFGAQLSDTEIDTVASAMNRLGRQIALNADEFEALGITAKDPLGALEQFADVFAGIEDPMQRAALANKVFGKSWEELAPLLSGGGQAFDELVEKGQRMSHITAELAAEAAKFNDSLDEQRALIAGLRNQAILPLVPVLNDVVKAFFDLDDAIAKQDQLDIGTLQKLYDAFGGGLVVFGARAEQAGLGVEILYKKLAALPHAVATLDFSEIDRLSNEFDKRSDDILKKIDDYAKNRLDGLTPKKSDQSSATERSLATQSDNALADESSGQSIGASGSKKTGIVSEFNKSLEDELTRHNKIIEGSIKEENSLFEFRLEKLDAAQSLGLVADAGYFREKEQLQKDQLAATETYIDQEINAVQFLQKQQLDAIDAQIKAQEKLRDSAKSPTEKSAAQGAIDNLQEQKLTIESNAQEKVNGLIQQKTQLERESQIQTLQNAAAAKQALGEQAEGLININGLLAQYNTNIIGMSKAQAELNTQIGGTATAADVVDKSKIFVSEDGKSFSDRPTEVGITLDLPQDQEVKVQEKLAQFRDKAVQDSAILLGVDIDQAAAIAKIGQANSAINESLAQVKPITLGMDVDQSLVISAAQRAREAAQAAIQPIIIPVVYQAQNSPSAAAPAGPSLTQAALAAGGR
jgi:hypothetical protein